VLRETRRLWRAPPGPADKEESDAMDDLAHFTTVGPTARCACGAALEAPAHLGACYRCTREALEAEYELVRSIVAVGACPDCGGEVTQNPHVGDLFECRQCLWRGATGR
jgi:hypothetical protein